MSDAFRIELMNSGHDRTAFSCGVEALDRYFRELSTQDMRRRVSNCFVALDASGKIAGYYTLSATCLPLTEIPPEQARRLPRYQAMPAGLVGRLAVDHAFQGQGLGSMLMVDAVRRSVQDAAMIFALIVDAKDEAAVTFYEHLGFIRFTSRPMSLFLPLAEAVRRLGLL